ncbi:hypothetical protein LMS37_14155, partial [Clostridium perfringens]|uniref:hypothetical protein n=1 Tax=Clostridium perfringens TaxID=1502 RepID=UPI001E4D6D1D
SSHKAFRRQRQMCIRSRSYMLNNFILNNTKTWIMLILNSIFIFLINTSIIISLNYIFDKEIIRSNLKRIYLIVSKGE